MAETISIRLDATKLHRLQGQLLARAEMVLDIAAHNIEEAAKEMAPVDTGDLRNSIAVKKTKPLERVIEVGAEYGMVVEYGSVAHEIRPRNAKALFWPGAAHPVKVVHHPGTPAQPFLTPAVEKERRRVKQAWEALFKP